MKTILIKGVDLTPVQIELMPKFNGLKGNKESFLECNSFYFSESGDSYTTNSNEYYPVCTSLKNLPH